MEIPRWEAYLKTIGYNKTQAARAELWITRGDWSFKGKLAKLEGSDFFPTDAKLKDLLETTNNILITRSEFNSLMRDYKQQGMLEERARTNSMYNDEERTKLTEEMQTVVQENMELRDKIVRLEKRISGIQVGEAETVLQELQLKCIRTENALQGALNDVMLLQDAIKHILSDENMYNHYRQQLRNRELHSGVAA